MKPTLFIGSSSESIEIAYAAQINLEEAADVVVWNQGISQLSKSILESLLDALDESDFGLFVLAPDDVTAIRGNEMKAPRDNVIFELGLFFGRLGRDRSFIVRPKGVEDFRLPSDLLGINTATFRPPPKPERWQAALGPACFQIRGAIEKVWESRESSAVGQSDNLDVITLILSEPQRKHLKNLARGRTKGYTGRGSLRSELRDLRARGLLQKLAGRNIGHMKSGMKFDLAEYVELTDMGKRLVERLK